MPRKRDGPRIAANDRGPGQSDDERPLPLPRAKTSRNPQGHILPPSHHRKRRRRPQGWRTFDVRVCLPPTSDAVHAMHIYLRTMARRFGLEIADIDEVHDPE
jgi:hypothetical protein